MQRLQSLNMSQYLDIQIGCGLSITVQLKKKTKKERCLNGKYVAC